MHDIWNPWHGCKKISEGCLIGTLTTENDTIKTEGMGTEMGHMCYKVVRGDTLYSISRRYHTSIANIVMLNRIQNPNLIYPGQCLKISR